jgi:hypothetical protein
MRKIIYLIIISAMIMSISTSLFAKSYPRQGGLKQLFPGRDAWYFIDDQNWYIHAPDKWQHFSGCYLAQRIGSNFVGKYKVTGIILLGAMAKEFDDAYREGWSGRDMLCNVLGILAGLNQSKKFQAVASLTKEKIELQLYFPLNL